MATKLKDGVFIGDAEASQDIDFLVSNKITRVINCAAASVPCSWERLGVRYLPFYWKDSDDCDLSPKNVARVLGFIDNALAEAESVLIHSIDGCSRACAVTAMFFMHKYIWGMQKTLLFLQNQRPDLRPLPNVMKQLEEVNGRLLYKFRSDETMTGRLNSVAWDVLPPGDATKDASDEELLINTYLNSRPADPQALEMAMRRNRRPGSARRRRRRRRLSWIDENKKATAPKSPFTGRPTTERPPGLSYSDINPGEEWVDTYQGGDTFHAGRNSGGARPRGESGSSVDAPRSILKVKLKSAGAPRGKAPPTAASNGDGCGGRAVGFQDKPGRELEKMSSTISTEPSKFSESQIEAGDSAVSVEEALKWRSDRTKESAASVELEAPSSIAGAKSGEMEMGSPAQWYQEDKVDEKYDGGPAGKRRTLATSSSRPDPSRNRQNSAPVDHTGTSKRRVDVDPRQGRTARNPPQPSRQTRQLVDGSLSSLIYTDEDSSDEDMNILLGLNRSAGMNYESRTAKSRRKPDAVPRLRRQGKGKKASSSLSRSSERKGSNNLSIGGYRTNSGRETRQKGVVGMSRQRVRRADRGSSDGGARRSAMQQVQGSYGGHERTRRPPSRDRDSLGRKSSQRRKGGGDGGRRRAPSPGPRVSSSGLQFNKLKLGKRQTPTRKKPQRRPGSAPIRKSASRMDYDGFNYSQGRLQSLVPQRQKRAGTPNVATRQKRGSRGGQGSMNLSSSLKSLSSMAANRQVFTGGTVGAIRQLRRRPSSAGAEEVRRRAQMRQMQMEIGFSGNKPIWR